MKFVLALAIALVVSFDSVSAQSPPTTQECQDAYREKVALLISMNQKGIHMAECVTNVNVARAVRDYFWQAYWMRVILADQDGAQEILVGITIIEGQLSILEGLLYDITVELNAMQIRLNQLNAILGQC